MRGSRFNALSTADTIAMKNNPIVYLSVTLFFISSAAAFGQETATDSSAKVYDLNNFRFRYQRYKALTFDYRMNGDFNSNRKSTDLSNGLTTTNSDFNIIANLQGNSFENSERLQRIQSFQVSINTTTNRNEPPATSSTSTVRSGSARSGSAAIPYLGYENTSRRYNGNKFILLDYGGDFSVSTNSVSSNNNKQLKNNRTSLNTGVGIGFGRGRIENVSDAVTSYFILRDIQQDGVLQNFTATQLENLADGIVKTRNDRYIGDNRFRYVDQITRLDSICKANGIIATNPVKLFTVLYDNFIFTSYFRETGNRHTLSLGVNNDYFRFTDNDEPYRRGFVTVGPKYEYINALQKSMFLQRKTSVTTSAAGLFYYLLGTSSDNNDQKIALQGIISVSHGYIYQPNTRTVIDLSAYAIASTTNRKNLRRVTSAVGLQLNSNYFISRRFSIFLNANMYQNFRNERNGDSFESINFRNSNFQFTFNSGLTYAFY
jgi:hypothetical protein